MYSVSANGIPLFPEELTIDEENLDDQLFDLLQIEQYKPLHEPVRESSTFVVSADPPVQRLSKKHFEEGLEDAWKSLYPGML